MLKILSLAGSVLRHVGGVHLARTLLSGTPASPLIAAGELIGWRVIFAFFGGIAWTHPAFRHHLLHAFASLL